MSIANCLRNTCCGATAAASGALAITSALATTFFTVATVWHGGRCFVSIVPNGADSCDVVPIPIVGGLISAAVFVAAYRIMQAFRNAMAPANPAQPRAHHA